MYIYKAGDRKTEKYSDRDKKTQRVTGTSYILYDEIKYSKVISENMLKGYHNKKSSNTI